jgi:uncharacterized membrane protein
MGLYKHNRALFFTSLFAISLIIFSGYLSLTTLNSYSLEKENTRLRHEIDSLKKQYSDENQMVEEVSKKSFRGTMIMSANVGFCLIKKQKINLNVQTHLLLFVL